MEVKNNINSGKERMKRTMPSYVCAMSENDFDTLQEIIEDKYTSFLDCYWLLCDYSQYISNLKYNKTKKEVLEIFIEIKDLKMTDVLRSLEDRIPEGKTVDIANDKKSITLVFYP